MVQAYISYPDEEGMPVKELKQFKRVSLRKGEEEQVQLQLNIPVDALKKWDLKQHKWKLYKGNYQLSIGESSADKKLLASFIIK